MIPKNQDISNGLEICENRCKGNKFDYILDEVMCLLSIKIIFFSKKACLYYDLIWDCQPSYLHNQTYVIYLLFGFAVWCLKDDDDDDDDDETY